MNIFVLDKDPVRAAEYMCDKHVVRMTMESAQLLCTAHWVGWQHMLNPPPALRGKVLKGWLQENIPLPKLVPQYSMTHVNHPSAKWARECWGNYNWLVRHALALCGEYTRRYGRTIKCEEIIRWANRYPPPVFENTNPDSPMAMTPFAQAMPDEYRVPGDAVQAYRNYYHGSKVRFAKWKYTQAPPWWNPSSWVTPAMSPMVTHGGEGSESPVDAGDQP